jgi:hypothetical protein
MFELFVHEVAHRYIPMNTCTCSHIFLFEASLVSSTVLCSTAGSMSKWWCTCTREVQNTRKDQMG